MRTWLAAMLIAMSVAGCATNGLRQWDPVFRGHDGQAFGVPAERMGFVFGSVAIAPPNPSVGIVSVILRPVGDASHEIQVIAVNRSFHVAARAPDLDDAAARVWVFSGQLPAGRYEVVRAFVIVNRSGIRREVTADHPLPMQVEAGGTLYLGRWQITPDAADVPGPKIHWDGDMQIFVRDTIDRDRAVIDRTRDPGRPSRRGEPAVNAVTEWLRLEGARK